MANFNRNKGNYNENVGVGSIFLGSGIKNGVFLPVDQVSHLALKTLQSHDFKFSQSTIELYDGASLDPVATARTSRALTGSLSFNSLDPYILSMMLGSDIQTGATVADATTLTYTVPEGGVINVVLEENNKLLSVFDIINISSGYEFELITTGTPDANQCKFDKEAKTLTFNSAVVGQSIALYRLYEDTSAKSLVVGRANALSKQSLRAIITLPYSNISAILENMVFSDVDVKTTRDGFSDVTASYKASLHPLSGKVMTFGFKNTFTPQA